MVREREEEEKRREGKREESGGEGRGRERTRGVAAWKARGRKKTVGVKFWLLDRATRSFHFSFYEGVRQFARVTLYRTWQEPGGHECTDWTDEKGNSTWTGDPMCCDKTDSTMNVSCLAPATSGQLV